MKALTVSQPPAPGHSHATHLARRALASFVVTFLLVRILVLLIMSRRVPDLYVHVGQTHVHHLNFGIVLLAAIGAWLLLAPPAPGGGGSKLAALLYGIGLALTFDEFGMWLHLGGGYWQRASYDAVIIVAALLGLVAFAPKLRKLRPRGWILATTIVTLLGLLAALAIERSQHAQSSLKELELRGPP